MPKTYLTCIEASEIAGVHRESVRRWCEERRGLGVKVGGRWRIDPDALRRFLRSDPITDIESVIVTLQRILEVKKVERGDGHCNPTIRAALDRSEAEPASRNGREIVTA